MFEGEATREKLRKLQPQAPLTIHLRQEIDRWGGWPGERCGACAVRGPGGGQARPGRSLRDVPRPPAPPAPPARLNRVVSLVGATLRDLRLAIAGTIALSDELAEALDALFSARVPRRWAKIRRGRGEGAARGRCGRDGGTWGLPACMLVMRRARCKLSQAPGTHACLPPSRRAALQLGGQRQRQLVCGPAGAARAAAPLAQHGAAPQLLDERVLQPPGLPHRRQAGGAWEGAGRLRLWSDADTCAEGVPAAMTRPVRRCRCAGVPQEQVAAGLGEATARLQQR